ncbi:MAG: redoxin domain-containing protein [Ferruginibacter sp.]
MTQPNTGETAPLFSLYDSDKNKINLEDYKGKNVLLLFFPFAFTSVCTKELCSIRDNISFYNSAAAQVFGISVDSLYVLKKFREEQGLNFLLLSDFNKEVSAAYGALYQHFPSFDYIGVSKRAAFIIDKKGIIRYAEVCASAGDMPDFQSIQQVLTSLG